MPRCAYCGIDSDTKYCSLECRIRAEEFIRKAKYTKEELFILKNNRNMLGKQRQVKQMIQETQGIYNNFVG